MNAVPQTASVLEQGWRPLLAALADVDFTTAADTQVAALLAALPPDDAALTPFVNFEPNRYTRNCVYRCARFELLVLCWPAGVRSPVHGHGGSRGFVAVSRGAIHARNFAIEAGGHEPGYARLAAGGTGVLRAGDVEVVGPDRDVHDVGAYGGDAVALHVYAAPIREFLIYDIVHDTCRAAVSRDDMPPPN